MNTKCHRAVLRASPCNTRTRTHKHINVLSTQHTIASLCAMEEKKKRFNKEFVSHFDDEFTLHVSIHASVPLSDFYTLSPRCAELVCVLSAWCLIYD